MTNAADFSFRSEVRPADRQQIREIVESTGFFHPWEVDIALELADERLSKGPASGYEFLFADDLGRTDGYACFGEIPCTRGSYDIYWIAVRRECQGKGLGRRLMQLVEQQIRGLAGRRIYLET
ncbi:MAG: GNAT family N-acetyltransferase, partial [Planctomycetaceae bacterium]